MANLIDWSQVAAKVEAYRTEYSHDSSHGALAHVLLETLFGLDLEGVQEASTDGPYDRGVDAVVIEVDRSKNTVHLFQVKCVDSFEKSSNHFPSSEIDKLLSFVDDVLQKRNSLRGSTNPLLWAKVQEIWALLEGSTPRFVVHLASNAAPLNPTERTRLLSALEPYRVFTIEEHDLAGIASRIVEARIPQIERDLRLVDNQYFERVDGNIRGLIATVDALELVSFISDPRHPDQVQREIFDSNVRVYLSERNRINQRIIRSALSEANSEFWYLNNGITLTCDSMAYAPMRAPRVHLTNVQIVNGGQTSNALFEAYRTEPERLKGVLVLVRIYETRVPEISARIAESTNSQTPIRSRDLRSNDSIQRQLEDSFKSRGYSYERKARQHAGAPPDLRVDALQAGQAYVAWELGLPEVASKDRGKVFGELYDDIFTDQSSVDGLLVPFLVYRHIEGQKRRLQRALRQGEPYDVDDLYLIDGGYHLLYALSKLVATQDLTPSQIKEALEHLPCASAAVKAAVRKEQSKDPAFAYKRFFKSGRARHLINDALAGREPGPQHTLL